MIALALAVALTVPVSNDVVPPLEVDRQTQAFMECVAHRESRTTPTAVSSDGSHRGMFQLNAAMGRGTAWHLLPWLRTWHPDARGFARQLRNTPVNKWPREMQEWGFVLTLHHEGDRWSGWRHWFLSGSPCNDLVPVGAR